VLSEALKDRTRKEQLPIVDVLAEMGPRAKAAFPVLAELLPKLSKEEADVRLRVIRALVAIDPDRAAPLVSPLLGRLLTHRNEIIQRLAAKHLQTLGARAEPALAELIRALTDRDGTARLLAACTIGKIGARARPAVGPLLQALKDESPNTGTAAALALWQVDPPSSTAIQALIEFLGEETRSARADALAALATIGPAARRAVPVLRRMVRDPAGSDRVAAALALARIERRQELGGVARDATAEAVWALTEMLASKEVDERIKAAHALGELGPDAGRAVPALTEILSDEEVRETAAEALGRIGGLSRPAVRALKAALEDDDDSMRLKAAVSLCRTREAVPEGLATLQWLLDTTAGPQAVEALGELGPLARPALPALLRLLRRHPDWFDSVAPAVRRIDPATAERQNLP
jgi:HEAT repeat protein